MKLDESSLGRANIWMNTLAMIKERPFHGFGLGNFRTFYPAFHQAVAKSGFDRKHRCSNVHNDFLEAAVEQGIPGFITFVFVLLVSSLFAFYIIIHGAGGEMKWVAIASVSSLLAFIVMALFWFPMDDVLPPFCLFFIMALLLFREKRQRNNLRLISERKGSGLLFGNTFCRLLVLDVFFRLFRCQELYPLRERPGGP